MLGDHWGTHRVVEPRGALPQAAWRLNNDTTTLFDNEVLLAVERLNIDSASFAQMEQAGDVAAQIAATVRERGKQHNPVTGSGGMLLGRVVAVGPALAADPRSGALRVGERVATLVSLTLTPLSLVEIGAVDAGRHQVAVDGQAILFASGAWAPLPEDLPEAVALAAFDVAGAAPQVTRLCTPGGQGALSQPKGRPLRVLVLGCGGKSGLLAGTAAKRAGATVIGVECSEAAALDARALGVFTEVVLADAADAVAVADAAVAAGGGEFDLTVSCVNVPNAEMGAILATRDGGTIYFFSMSTQFTKAALGAEGISRDVTMLIGNGYCPDHAQATLHLLRTESTLRSLFIRRFG